MANELTYDISRHYLQVQALTPESGAPPPTATVVASSDWSSLILPSVIIFLVIVILGIAALIIFKNRSANQVFMVISFALLTSVIPASLKIAGQPASVATQADAGLIPQQVIVDSVTPQSFTIRWETDKASVGALRYQPVGSPDTYVQIFSEKSDQGLYTHIVVIDNLTPNTTYAVSILSGDTWYNDQGQPLNITTSSY